MMNIVQLARASKKYGIANQCRQRVGVYDVDTLRKGAYGKNIVVVIKIIATTQHAIIRIIYFLLGTVCF